MTRARIQRKMENSDSEDLIFVAEGMVFEMEKLEWVMDWFCLHMFYRCDGLTPYQLGLLAKKLSTKSAVHVRIPSEKNAFPSIYILHWCN